MFTGQEMKILGYSIKMKENSQKISEITPEHFLSLNSILGDFFGILFSFVVVWGLRFCFLDFFSFGVSFFKMQLYVKTSINAKCERNTTMSF